MSKFAMMMLVAALAVAPNAHPQQAGKPPEGCSEKANDGNRDCFIWQFAKADEDMNKVYPSAIVSMKKQDSQQVEQLRGYEEALRKSQRAWISYRDAQCELASFNARGGSEAVLERLVCATRLTKERTQFLREYAGAK
jgi:uncharacterized protein YecT (DUF1311 family)